MSGGYFDYKQHGIEDIIDGIRRVKNHQEWREFTKETKEEFKKAIKVLKVAGVYAQRIDWLISCDDSEESFHERLDEELKELDK